ncbi:hypothetical protein DENSPDRAFT_843798 [Dentipellis sp. KUC8613]|nr:hypothetical protein DENSPDRAFT_843798 [Dentipellis sp. KUC8613]
MVREGNDEGRWRQERREEGAQAQRGKTGADAREGDDKSATAREGDDDSAETAQWGGAEARKRDGGVMTRGRECTISAERG